jgi:hypothetical protein
MAWRRTRTTRTVGGLSSSREWVHRLLLFEQVQEQQSQVVEVALPNNNNNTNAALPEWPPLQALRGGQPVLCSRMRKPVTC